MEELGKISSNQTKFYSRFSKILFNLLDIELLILMVLNVIIFLLVI